MRRKIGKQKAIIAYIGAISSPRTYLTGLRFRSFHKLRRHSCDIIALCLELINEIDSHRGVGGDEEIFYC